MHSIAAKYLKDYIKALEETNCEDQIYGELANWQYDEVTKGRQQSAAHEVNAMLELRAERQLRGDHPATTAVGRLDAILFR